MTSPTIRPSKSAVQHLSAYDRYSTECLIHGISPRPVGEWLSLPSVGTAQMIHEAKITAENQSATLTATTVVVVAKPAHSATSVRKLASLAARRAAESAKRAERREKLRQATDRIAEKCEKTHNPSPNRPDERALAMAERERWIRSTMPLIIDALGLSGDQATTMAMAVAEAWLQRKELDTEKRISRNYQNRIWESMPTSRWKGMTMGVEPADTISNHSNALRTYNPGVTDKATAEMIAWARQVSNSYATGRPTPKVVVNTNSAFCQRINRPLHRVVVDRPMPIRGRLFPSSVNPFMEA